MQDVWTRFIRDMQEMKKRDWHDVLVFVYGLFTAGVALSIYVKTLAPTVSFFDSGELISAAYCFGVAHPPGYPLYVALGRLFGMLPYGTFAFRINMMSALFAALAVLTVYGITYILLGDVQQGCQNSSCSHAGKSSPNSELMLRPIFAMIAALSFAFSLTHWQQALIAEVYSLNACFCGLIVWLLLLWYRGSRPLACSAEHRAGQRGTQDRVLSLIAFLFGLGFGNHQTISLLAIAAGFLVTVGRTRILLQPRTLLKIVISLMLGLSIYGLAPLGAAQNPAVNWGNPVSWRQFTWLITREAYDSAPSGYALSALKHEFFDEEAGERLFPDGTEGGDVRLVKKHGAARYYHVLKHSLLWKQLQSFDPLEEFGVFGTVLALMGLAWGVWRDWRTGSCLLIAVTSLVLIIVAIGDPPEENIFLLKEFHSPAYLLTAVWIGLGMMASAKAVLWLAPWRACREVVVLVCALYFMLPVGSRFLRTLPKVDRHRNYVAYDYAANIMTSLQRNAILFTWGDSGAFPLWYLQIVEEQRPDVTLVHVPHLTSPWYLDQLPPDLFESPAPAETYDKDLLAVLEDIVRKNLDTRPVYFDFSSAHSLKLPYWLLPNGITYKVRRPGDVLDETVWERYRFRGILEDTAIARDSDIDRSFLMYGSARMELGNYYLERGELERASEQFNLAVQLAPELGGRIIRSLKFRDKFGGERIVAVPHNPKDAQ